MRSLLVLCLAVSFSCSQKLKSEVALAWEEMDAPFVDICVNETNIDPMIPKVMYRQLHLPDEEKFHCYMKCIFERLDMLTDDHQIDGKKLYGEPFLPNELVDRCLLESIPETDLCRKTYLFSVCCIEEHYE